MNVLGVEIAEADKGLAFQLAKEPATVQRLRRP